MKEFQTLLQGRPYTPSHKTDIRETFRKARGEPEESDEIHELRQDLEDLRRLVERLLEDAESRSDVRQIRRVANDKR